MRHFSPLGLLFSNVGYGTSRIYARLKTVEVDDLLGMIHSETLFLCGAEERKFPDRGVTSVAWQTIGLMGY